MKKGDPKIPGSGRNFIANDPRINRDIPGPGRPLNPDARIIEIQAHMRWELAETMFEVWKLPFKTIQDQIKSGTLSTGQMIAYRFLEEAGLKAQQPHFQTILKVLGLQPPDNVQVSVNVSLEDLVTRANAIETTATVIEEGSDEQRQLEVSTDKTK